MASLADETRVSMGIGGGVGLLTWVSGVSGSCVCVLVTIAVGTDRRLTNKMTKTCRFGQESWNHHGDGLVLF